MKIKVGASLLDDYIKATAVSCARDADEKKLRADLDDLDKRVSSPGGEVPEEFVVRFRRLIDSAEATRQMIRQKVVTLY